eukprot:1950532-Rhodomonas_salina.1
MAEQAQASASWDQRKKGRQYVNNTKIIRESSTRVGGELEKDLSSAGRGRGSGKRRARNGREDGDLAPYTPYFLEAKGGMRRRGLLCAPFLLAAHTSLSHAFVPAHPHLSPFTSSKPSLFQHLRSSGVMPLSSVTYNSVTADPYIGTKLGTAREQFCAAMSNTAEGQAGEALKWIEVALPLLS